MSLSEARNPVGDPVAGGEQQYRQAVTACAQPPAGLQTVQPGHEHIQHDRIRPLLLDAVQRLDTITSDRDLVPLEPQGPLQRLANRLLVVNHQDAHGNSLIPVPEKS
jgi:hypothetical protein